MSDEKPFCHVSDPFDALRPLWFGKANPTLGEPATPPGYGLIACAVNEQQSARERKAAAKALRAFADSEALKDDFGHGEVITKHDVRTEMRAAADQVEKGEA